MQRFPLLPEPLLRRTSLAFVASFLAGASATSLAAAQEPNFEDFARRAQERFALGGVRRTPDAFDLLLRSRCHRAELGAFDIYFPADEAEGKGNAKILGEVACDLVGLQRAWVDWNHASESEAIVADLDELEKWCKKWSTGSFKKLDAGTETDLATKMGAKDGLRAASSRAREALLRTAEEGKPLAPTRMLLAPRRGTFLELAAFAGWCDEQNQEALWHERTWTTTSAWIGDMQLVAFEYPLMPLNPEKPELGQSMNVSLKTGMRQHTVDRGAASLLTSVFHRYADPLIETTLVTNLVIATIGENDLSFDISSVSWSRKGATTRAVSRFIPAGGTFGQAIKPRKAKAGPVVWQLDYKPTWRMTAGKDYFKKPLQAGQKNGAKEASKDRDLADAARANKLAHFPLSTEKGGERFLVTAPFLGSMAEGKEPPPAEYLDDYEEFFRAYQASFFEWLRTEAVSGDPDLSRQSFAALMRHLTDQRNSDDLEEAVKIVYGTELSEPLGSTCEESPTLEWQFLRWIKEGR